MEIIKKDYQSEVKAYNEKDLTIEHFISTESEDRYGDIVRADGMKIRGKPVVLLGHGYGSMGTEPIAKPLWIKAGKFKNKKGVLAKTQYFDDEQGIGRRLWGKASQGYMPNWSIGFIPKESEERKNGGRDIKVWELLEYSQVGVPANPDAQSILSDINANKFDGLMQYKIMPLEFEKDFISDDSPSDKKNFEDGDLKPYPNEHACRLNDSDKYDKIRRQNNKFGDGIHAIWGIKGDDTELQAIRFSKDKHSESEAKAWCKEHDYDCKPFEAASGKDIESEPKKKEADIMIKFDTTDLKAVLNGFLDNLKELLTGIKINNPNVKKETEPVKPEDESKIIPRLRIIDNTPEKKTLTAEQITELAIHVRNQIKVEMDKMRGKVS